MRTVRAALFVVLAAAVLGGCKRHKPPARARVWLGPSHGCSLQETSRELECWGDNRAGQLGDGTTTSRTLPAPVAAREVLGAVDEVAIGGRHTCVLSRGAVRCWGDGARGQLGTGRTDSLTEPSAPAIGGGAPLTGVMAIAAGGDRSCALVAERVLCWGDGVLEAQMPAAFYGRASAVSVGVGFACAAFVEPREVRCMGADDRGQSAAERSVFVGATVAAISAGTKHACAALDDGAVWCWGANDYGQLGDGTTEDSRMPALVRGLPAAAAVRVGATHTCARLRNNTVACWGDNRAHQLVNGTSTPSTRPVPIPGLVGVAELAVGGDSGCARMAQGEVRCWGANTLGQLGDGTNAAHQVPMPVKSAPKTAR